MALCKLIYHTVALALVLNWNTALLIQLSTMSNAPLSAAQSVCMCLLLTAHFVASCLFKVTPLGGCHGDHWKLKEPIHIGVILAIHHPLIVWVFSARTALHFSISDSLFQIHSFFFFPNFSASFIISLSLSHNLRTIQTANPPTPVWWRTRKFA